jgi:hypothetical protein
MTYYTIKSNVPNHFHGPIHTHKERAKEIFLNICKELSAKYPCKMFLRDTNEKPLRGQIQVEIDGFFYYVELYIKQ